MESENHRLASPEFLHILGKVVASHVAETRQSFDSELKEILQRHEDLLLKLLERDQFQASVSATSGLQASGPAVQESNGKDRAHVSVERDLSAFKQPSGDLEDVTPEVVDDTTQAIIVEDGACSSNGFATEAPELSSNQKGLPRVLTKRLSNLFELINGDETRQVKRLPWWRDMDDPHSSWIALRYSQLMNPIIMVSVMLAVLSKFDPPIVEGFTGDWTEKAQIGFDLFFCSELLLRFCVAYAKCNFLIDPFNITDLLASFPNLVLAAVISAYDRERVDEWPVSTMAVRFLCPLFKVCKILRRFPTFQLLLSAFEESMEALPVLMFVFGLIGLTFASLLFIVETQNPNPTGNNITSFQQSIWMTLITMTTVGYGDFFPGTPWGRFFVGCLVVIQVLYMALPLGILGQEFTHVWIQRHRFLAIKRIKTRMTALSLTFNDIPALFKQFGRDDGTIDADGFRRLCDALGIKMKMRQMKELYESLDHNVSNRLEPHEFSSAIFPKEYIHQLDADQSESEHVSS